MRFLSKHVLGSRRDAVCSEKVVRARLLFARELLVSYGVPYKDVWRYAGFASECEMSACWDRLF